MTETACSLDEAIEKFGGFLSTSKNRHVKEFNVTVFSELVYGDGCHLSKVGWLSFLERPKGLFCLWVGVFKAFGNEVDGEADFVDTDG